MQLAKYKTGISTQNATLVLLLLLLSASAVVVVAVAFMLLYADLHSLWDFFSLDFINDSCCIIYLIFVFWRAQKTFWELNN